MLLFKRCYCCDITDDALISASHPMADFYESTQGYQEFLNHIEWFKSPNNNYYCGDCQSAIIEANEPEEDEEDEA